MKTSLVVIAILFAFCSCAGVGPVYVAKNENEAIKTSYEDKQAKELYSKYSGTLASIYSRYNESHIDIYNEGIGITTLKDADGQRLYFFMANVRPQDLKFDVNTTTGQKRFAYAIKQIPTYMKYINRTDLEKEDIQGLEMGIYWGVKDYKKCDQYGGFIEYIHIFFKKADALAVLAGNKTFQEAVADAEVVTSLDLKPAVSVRPTF